MKRSTSLSSIPLPAHVRSDSKNRIRSKSNLRQSREKSMDRLTPSYRPGPNKFFDKKGVTTPVTPLCSTGARRNGSSSSCYSQGASASRAKSPSTAAMQKLVNNKKWVSEQYSKVQRFIRDSGLCDPELAGMIRPPTINTFVELMSILFDQLITKGVINTQNYTDIILSKMKMLRYPGVLTVSTIKSVNTTHGWPQFICMVSWLIDRVYLAKSVAVNYSEETQNISERQEMLWNFFNNRYNIFSEGADEDLISKENMNLLSSLAAFTETDFESAHIAKTNYDALNRELTDLELQIDECTKQNDEIQESNSRMSQVIDAFQDNKVQREQKINKELQQCQKTVARKREKRDAMTEFLKQLRQDIANQSCKIKQKEDMLNEIKDLKRTISRKEKKFTEYRLIRDDLDRNLTAAMVEIESRVDAWNVALTKTFLSEMKILHLREKGFHSGGFLQEIEEKFKEKQHLEKQLLEELNNIHVELNKIQHRKDVLYQDTKQLQDKNKELSELIGVLQSDNQQIQSEIRRLETLKKTYDVQIVEMKKILTQGMHDIEAKIEELDNQIQQVTKQFNNLAAKGLSLLLQVHNMTKKHFMVIDEQMQKILYNLCDRNERDRQTLNTMLLEMIEAKKAIDTLEEALSESD